MSNIAYKITSAKTVVSLEPEAASSTFSNQEIRQLKTLLKYVRYDENQQALLLENGKSRILCRADGTLRIEGEAITTTAQGAVQINGAIIDLN